MNEAKSWSGYFCTTPITTFGPAIGRYREPADQDRFAREEAARFLALLTQAERERAARPEEPYLRLVPPSDDGDER